MGQRQREIVEWWRVVDILSRGEECNTAKFPPRSSIPQVGLARLGIWRNADRSSQLCTDCPTTVVSAPDQTCTLTEFSFTSSSIYCPTIGTYSCPTGVIIPTTAPCYQTWTVACTIERVLPYSDFISGVGRQSRGNRCLGIREWNLYRNGDWTVANSNNGNRRRIWSVS
jgi:hypothetical protein